MHEFISNNEEREDRKNLFREIADFLYSAQIFPDNDIILYPDKIPVVVDGYFILSRAYKNWKINEKHLTERAKIAALSCMAIMTFQPFIPLALDKAETDEQAKCNEIYALTCASAILNASLKYRVDASSNLMYRIMDILSECRSETLEPFLLDLEFEIPRAPEDYNLTIDHRDKLPINALISVFELVPIKK